MNYPEPNRAGSHGTSGVGIVIVLSVRYVLLITCWSAEDDAVGAWLTLPLGARGDVLTQYIASTLLVLGQ
jgi:hypothetical protein